jgi:hypothetical protein
MNTVMSLLNSEWSYFVVADNIGSKPVELTISSNEHQNKDIARRLGLDKIEDLSAALVLERQGKGNVILVSGSFEAHIQQQCIVSNESQSETISDRIEAWYTDHDEAVSLTKVRHERLSRMIDSELPLLEEKDDPEPIIDGKIDLGELVIQHLSLSLNPYPKTTDKGYDIDDHNVTVTSVDSVGNSNKKTNKPFSELKNWKNKDKNQ